MTDESCSLCSCGETLRELIADRAALLAVAEAARQRVRRGCNDTCAHQVAGPEYECSCGHDALRAALAAFDATRSDSSGATPSGERGAR